MRVWGSIQRSLGSKWLDHWRKSLSTSIDRIDPQEELRPWYPYSLPFLQLFICCYWCVHTMACAQKSENNSMESVFSYSSVFQESNSDHKSCMVSPFAHQAILPGHFLSPNDNFRYENNEWDRVLLTIITVFGKLMWENCKFVADLRYV